MVRAKLTVGLAGHPMREIGEEVSGEEAARLIAAGFAELIAEPEKATREMKRETATSRRVMK